MPSCSVTKSLKIVPGGHRDYEGLGCYHYRGGRLGVYAAIFALKGRFATAECPHGEMTVGVIVYTMPVAGLELRDIATGGFFSGLDRSTRLGLLNKHVRCISRVIIEPRFRGLGLAARLVRETMPRMGVVIVEAMAVMGRVNRFFEKAGMTAYEANVPARCVRLLEALGVVGIESRELIDAKQVQQKNERLGRAEAEFVEAEIKRFLQSYGKRRAMKPGLERTRYVLSKLTERPVYYIWQNPDIQSERAGGAAAAARRPADVRA